MSNRARTWWSDDGGNCMLKGVADDPYNPIRMPDDFILAFLHKIPTARTEFVVLLPTLLPEEQTRLNDLIAANPYVQTLMPGTQQQEDALQSKWNRAGVRLEMPRRVLQ